MTSSPALSDHQRPKVRVLCLPDVDRPIGGVKQLFRHVEHLQALGLDAKVLTQSAYFHPSWFSSTAATAGFQASYASGDLDSATTILVLPETYVSAALSAFEGVDLSRFPRVVLNQNANF